jgi:hypothetical protein
MDNLVDTLIMLNLTFTKDLSMGAMVATFINLYFYGPLSPA